MDTKRIIEALSKMEHRLQETRETIRDIADRNGEAQEGMDRAHTALLDIVMRPTEFMHPHELARMVKDQVAPFVESRRDGTETVAQLVDVRGTFYSLEGDLRILRRMIQDGDGGDPQGPMAWGGPGPAPQIDESDDPYPESVRDVIEREDVQTSLPDEEDPEEEDLWAGINEACLFVQEYLRDPSDIGHQRALLLNILRQFAGAVETQENDPDYLSAVARIILQIYED